MNIELDIDKKKKAIVDIEFPLYLRSNDWNYYYKCFDKWRYLMVSVYETDMWIKYAEVFKLEVILQQAVVIPKEEFEIAFNNTVKKLGEMLNEMHKTDKQ